MLKIALLPLATLLASLVTAQSAVADVLLGRILTPQGAPLANVNLDVFDAITGAELALTGDFTAPDGTFVLIVPTGTYDVVAHPPAPPATPYVGRRVPGVTVAGTANVGDVTLELGVVLQGRVLRPGGVPAVGADLEGRDLDSGGDVVFSVTQTDINGSFVTSAPVGTLRLSIDPGVDLPLSAPQRLVFQVAGPLNLGNITLETGYFVTVVVRRTNGTPIPNADIDVVDATTGEKLITTDDDTNASGLADFIVPAGFFDLEICAPTATRLAPTVVTGVTVTGPTNAGLATLTDGGHLSGTVRNAQGQLASGIDLDLFLPGTQTKVLTCADDTNASGQYLTTVPVGTFDVLFEDVTSDCPESILIPNVVITGDRTLNAALTAPGLGCRYCLPSTTNSAGQRGLMDASGSANVGQNNVTLIARDLPNFVFGFFINSRAQGFVAQPGTSAGVLCLSGNVGRYNKPSQIGMSGSTGTITVPIDLTQTPTPQGFISILPGDTWHFQAWYRDLTAGGNSNFTSGLFITFE